MVHPILTDLFNSSPDFLRALAKNGEVHILYQSGKIMETAEFHPTSVVLDQSDPIRPHHVFVGTARKRDGVELVTQIITHQDYDETASNTIEFLIGSPVATPIMGKYYSRPTPEEPPFVQVGDMVEAGQPLCLIERNKTFSELPAPFTGKITKICTEENIEVEEGQILFYLDPAGGQNE
ncbi:MAG TPA: biotin/lipoyl-containing protein [Candidatus Saccharimonadales bacterium]|nr:biotin/lipoyl-containing protein [Candidatus Saccharimonadales bacterium]